MLREGSVGRRTSVATAADNFPVLVRTRVRILLGAMSGVLQVQRLLETRAHAQMHRHGCHKCMQAHDLSSPLGM